MKSHIAYVERYKKYCEVFHKGTLYRLSSPFESNFAAFEFISEDENTVILVCGNILCKTSSPIYNIKLAGLDPNADYEKVEEEKGELLVDKAEIGRIFGGDELMERGINICNCRDFESLMLVFKKIN